MKVFVCALICFAVVVAEPPVPSNRYLPGATFNSAVNVKGNFPSATYGTPTQYSIPSQQYLPSQYNAPSHQTYNTPSTQYGAPTQYNQHEESQPIISSSQYVAPSTQYGVPSQYNAPSSQYGVPAVRSNTPSTTYGVPSAKYGVPSARYGAPSYARSNYEEHSEPANYNFQYDVQEQHEGTDFGHAETRQGEHAQGRYYVTLPDGRKQTVDYTADEQGFKPQISYEKTNNYASRSGNYNNQGYVNGGYSQNGY
ncbi:pro-resilin-like [Onthophagus taurus]|uniref:pro-resilin-like n=1 Tax=Onthophagus taurus TaxID=166361 RepID=UPI0039BE3069